MINYVEYLRAMRGLRIIAIILGLIFLCAVITRISFFRTHTWDDAIVKISQSPTAHVTKLKQPDGSTKTIIDDPAQKTHAEITDRGYAGKQIVITKPAKRGEEQHVVIGSVSMNQDARKGGMEHVVVQTNDRMNLGWLMLGALPWMLLFASLVAGPLAKENDGHLELAWTRPVSRTSYALGAIAIDFAGILVTAIASIIVYLICSALFQLPQLTINAAGVQVFATCIFAAFGFYALVAAVTSSLKMGPGLVIGIIWAAIAILPALMQIDGPAGSAWHVIGLTFRGLNHLNPLSYVAHTVYLAHDEPALSGAGGQAPYIALGLTVVYLAAALVQWRRVEA